MDPERDLAAPGDRDRHQPALPLGLADLELGRAEGDRAGRRALRPDGQVLEPDAAQAELLDERPVALETLVAHRLHRVRVELEGPQVVEVEAAQVDRFGCPQPRGLQQSANENTAKPQGEGRVRIPTTVHHARALRDQLGRCQGRVVSPRDMIVFWCFSVFH